MGKLYLLSNTLVEHNGEVLSSVGCTGKALSPVNTLVRWHISKCTQMKVNVLHCRTLLYLVYWKDENAVAALPEKDMMTTATIGEMADVRVGKAIYPAQVVAIGELHVIVCVHSCWGLYVYAHVYDCACLLLHSYYSDTDTYRDKRRNGFSREKVSDERLPPRHLRKRGTAFSRRR